MCDVQESSIVLPARGALAGPARAARSPDEPALAAKARAASGSA
jgi:hypothetical protein